MIAGVWYSGSATGTGEAASKLSNTCSSIEACDATEGTGEDTA